MIHYVGISELGEGEALCDFLKREGVECRIREEGDMVAYDASGDVIVRAWVKGAGYAARRLTLKS